MTAVLGRAQAVTLAQIPIIAKAMALALVLQAAPHAAVARPQAAPPAVRLVSRPAEPWTWTLYSGDGPLVLANEIPDTPQLRATLECAPGSSIARVTFYETPGADGFATAASGPASAGVEARSRRGRLETALRADHPVFAAFLASGRLSVTVGEHAASIEVDRPNLPKLRRFAELCTG